MTADFAKMQEIFLAAVERHRPEDWDAYLEQACADDPELRRQVDRLLKAHLDAGSVPGPAAPEPDQTGGYQTPAVAPEEVSDTSKVSDTSETPAAPPAAEEVSDTVPVSDTKPARSRRHVPRAERRTRTTTVREKPKTRKPITRLPKPEGERGRTQERRGVVVSSAMEKTIVVRVDTLKMHPRYKKVIRRSSKLHAHDEQNAAKAGDVVRIVESRPLSKTKRWRLAEILEAAK